MSCIIQSNCHLRLKGGRPKGSTNESIKAASDSLAAVKNKIYLKYIAMKDEAAANSMILKNGTLEKLVAGLLKKRNIQDGCIIKSDTIRCRISRHRLVVNQLGSVSPLVAIIQLLSLS